MKWSWRVQCSSCSSKFGMSWVGCYWNCFVCDKHFQSLMDNVEVERFCTLSSILSITANLQNRTSRRTSMKYDSIKKKKVAFDDQCLVHCFIDHRNKNVHKYEKRTNIQSSFEMLRLNSWFYSSDVRQESSNFDRIGRYQNKEHDLVFLYSTMLRQRQRVLYCQACQWTINNELTHL